MTDKVHLSPLEGRFLIWVVNKVGEYLQEQGITPTEDLDLLFDCVKHVVKELKPEFDRMVAEIKEQPLRAEELLRELVGEISFLLKSMGFVFVDRKKEENKVIFTAEKKGKKIELKLELNM